MLLSIVVPLALAACNAPETAKVDNRSVEAKPDAPVSVPVAPSPQAAPRDAEETDGAARTVKLADGQAVTIEPFRMVKKQGLSDSQCGIAIAGQRLMTMGAGETEVYTCYELIGAGALPADRGVARMGLLYDVGSPNASFSTAVILRREPTGWAVDESRAGEFDDRPEAKSIEALAKAVR